MCETPLPFLLIKVLRDAAWGNDPLDTCSYISHVSLFLILHALSLICLPLRVKKTFNYPLLVYPLLHGRRPSPRETRQAYWWSHQGCHWLFGCG